MTLEKIFMQSPTIQRLMAINSCQTTQNNVLHLLERRFGGVPEDLAAHVRAIREQDKLNNLLDLAVDCVDMEAFRNAISGP